MSRTLGIEIKTEAELHFRKWCKQDRTDEDGAHLKGEHLNNSMIQNVGYSCDIVRT